MRRNLTMLCAAAALLGGCSDGSTEDAVLHNGVADNAAMTVEADGTTAPQPAQADNRSMANEAVAILPPAGAEYRYVGRWAATEQLCENGAWRFEQRRLSTAGEVSCDFNSVEQVPGGYDIAATCLAEGTRSEDTLELRFAESAGAMLVSSDMWNGVGLIPCEG